MRYLTSRQANALDRIASSSAAATAKVVGWANDGPVIKLKSGQLVALTPAVDLEPVEELKT